MERVQKELAFWQTKLQDTMGLVKNDEQIAALQGNIDAFIAEAENVNA